MSTSPKIKDYSEDTALADKRSKRKTQQRKTKNSSTSNPPAPEIKPFLDVLAVMLANSILNDEKLWRDNS